MEDLTLLSGRQWIANQEDSSILEDCSKVPVIENHVCNRCGSKVECKLPSGKLYCRACIGLGRANEGDLLIRCHRKVAFPELSDGGMTWRGQLTPLQQQISDKLVINFKQKQNGLVHAVTGAGKTEMLFQLIAECMKKGKRACIATPRIDVVNELFPRFEVAFAEIGIGKYHGREHQEPNLDQLTICTTHQLLKFYEAFDLLVIDEVDSFPYVGNEQLHFAAKNAVKKDGVRVYLTATPTDDLLAEVKQGKIQILKLNRRFHGGLLPVPREKLFIKPFLNRQGQIHVNLLSEIIKGVKSRHPLLIFIPRIEQIQVYLAALRKKLANDNVKIAGVHAQDPQRIEKVAAFRQRKYDILLTTTILERGVTFKNVWVIIVAADDPIYTAASLVQIAGRVGRAKDDKNGLVLYCYHRYTKNIRISIKQIKEMNK